MLDSLPQQRCCETHANWTELIDHLTRRFPQVRADEVGEIVAHSRQAAQDFGLPEHEQLETVEMMARYQLLQLTGALPDNARMMPEHHHRASS